MDVDKFGSPPSYQICPSILRMPCAKTCPQEINISHPEPTRKRQQGTLYEDFPSFLRKSTKSPSPSLGPPKKNSPQITPPPR